MEQDEGQGHHSSHSLDDEIGQEVVEIWIWTVIAVLVTEMLLGIAAMVAVVTAVVVAI